MTRRRPRFLVPLTCGTLTIFLFRGTILRARAFGHSFRRAFPSSPTVFQVLDFADFCASFEQQLSVLSRQIDKTSSLKASK